MKRYLFAIMAIMLLLTGHALAMSREEWEAQCTRKISGGTTLYRLTEVQGDDPAADVSDYALVAVGTLEGGTYVKVMDAEYEGKTAVKYMDASGSVQDGYVDPGALASATVTLDIGIEFDVTVPESIRGDVYAIADYVERRYGYVVDAQSILQYWSSQQEGEKGEEEGSDKNYKKIVTQSAQIRLVDENGQEQPVKVEYLGTAVSVVVLNREKLTVSTSDLRWDTSAPAEKQLAVVDAPNSGKVTLRTKASNKADGIKKVQTNKILLVMEIGKRFTKVSCDGIIGYIVNSALEYYPVGGVKEGEAPPTPGWVSFRGKLNSRNTINVRQYGKNGSRILKDFIAGTPIMVFSQTERWSEIDVGGYRAYILTEYVTLDETEDAKEE